MLNISSPPRYSMFIIMKKLFNIESYCDPCHSCIFIICIQIGKRCPEAGDEDSCELAVDENALYEGPNADLYPATDWRACYQECM